MQYISVFLALSCLFNAITAAQLTGAFKNIPNDVPELAKELRQTIPNLYNYPLRITVDLYKLNGKGRNHDFVPLSSAVDKNYRFTFKNLADGEYQLIANSYDFAFTNGRYKVVVDNDNVLVYESPLGQEQSNASVPTELAQGAPLEIEFKEIKQFYEKSGGTVYDMLLNSPFGFIFRNKTYTVIFVVLLVISIAPTVAQWVNPEFAEQFKEVQAQAATLRLQKADTSLTPQSIPVGAGPGATGVKNTSAAVKKRR